VTTDAKPANLLNLAHIAQTLLGRAEAERVLASRLGPQRMMQIFDELAARAAAD
jgi:hypothetical protein